jgi:hypothetical protein
LLKTKEQERLVTKSTSEGPTGDLPLLKKYCPTAKGLSSLSPRFFPKLFANQLITTAVVMHAARHPDGSGCEQTDMGPGSLVESLPGCTEEVPVS